MHLEFGRAASAERLCCPAIPAVCKWNDLRALPLLQAGAVRAVLAEAAAAVHPLVHAQRTLGAGAAAAGLFAVGGLLEQEQRRMAVAAEQQRAWEEEQWGEAGAGPSRQVPGGG